jgi:inosose dehydratase
MQIAYSTYALQDIDPFEAVTRVREIGYDALEINCGVGWPTVPERFAPGQRSRLRDALQDAGFPPPPVMNLIGLCAAAREPAAESQQLGHTCKLARDLSWRDGPSVVTTTLGPQTGSWDQAKEAVAGNLRGYGDLVARHNCILAIEPHIGQELDTPEKANWLMQAVDHPHVRLNFDYSHFLVQGIDLAHSLKLTARYAVHAHIKDGRMVDGTVRFALPGDDQLDLAAYLHSMRAAGLNMPITAEVSGQIWRGPDYDPWQVAQRCFANLDAARGTLEE